MRSKFENVAARFCGGGIALSAAWDMATWPEPLVNHVVDKGVAATGAAIGAVLLVSLAVDLHKSLAGSGTQPDDHGHGPS